jgi:diguanylate cyclase (GGDEF)-like protein/PAS domain S-box-containing protein
LITIKKQINQEERLPVARRNYLASLQGRITLIVVLLVLVCVWGFAFGIASRQENRLRELVAVQQHIALGYVAENIDSLIRLRLDSLTKVAATIPHAHLKNRGRLIETLAERPLLQVLFDSGIIVARPDGRGAFADYPPLPGRSEVDFRGLDFFENVLFDERPVMGRPFLGRFLDKPVVTFAAPVFDAAGGIAAVLIGITTLDAPNFLDLVTKRLPEGGGDLIVASPQHQIFVAGTDPAFMLRPIPINQGNMELIERAARGFQGSLVSDRLDGTEYLISVRSIPTADWVIAARLPTAEAFAPVREQRRFILIGAGILSLVIGLWVAFYLRHALGPLGRAADRLDEMTQGSAPLAPIPAGRDDEVGRLVRSFNHLQERIKRESAALRLAGSVIENTIEGVLISDPTGRIVDVNPAFTAITGYSREEVLGQNPRILQSGRQDEEFYAAMWQALVHRGHWRGEIWNRRKDGEVYPELLTISAVPDESGATSHYVAVFSDISQIKQHQRQLESIAHFDVLTGLPNRLLLADRMRQSIALTQRAGHLLAVCYLDLDGFKAVNDTLGHEAGDALLVEVAQRLKGCVRGGDTVSRLGGDEFVLLLAELERIDECETVLDRVVQAVAKPCVVAGQPVAVSTSIGLTLYPMDDADPDTLMRHADQAMYKSKQAGGNCYHLFDAEQDRRSRQHLEIIARIEGGLERGEFVLHYQPQVDLRKGCIVGAEALIRWNDPEHGLLPPADFLPEIEHHDLIVALGEWVIETALGQLAAWHAAGLELRVSVNVAARHLQRDDFMVRLRRLLDRHPDAPAGFLEIEVVETAAIEDIGRVSRIIEACRDLGVRFAIDDFGTGYSSLTYFKFLPVDTLKIDRSFIRDMLVDADDLAIVEGIVGLAAIFRRRVVAEGVETLAHGMALVGIDCDLAQGYGIARPMPPAEFTAWVKSWEPDPAFEQIARNRWARDDIQLLVAEVNHRTWVDGIAALLSGIAVGTTPEHDPQACSFGQWYDNAGKARYGHLPEYRAIDAVHKRIHAVGAQALDLHGAGRNGAACELMPELFRLREELIGRLHALQSSVGNRRAA